MVWAAALLAALLAGLLVAWFAAGWREVRTRQAATRDEPRATAAARAGELARELRGELEALIARESPRPYFYYQNLYHDPKGTIGVSVTPSPLANGPDDPLVLGYFQIDARGRVTTPTINDEVPAMSEPTHAAQNRQFRDEVTRELAKAIGPGSATMVAVVTPRHRDVLPQPAQQQAQVIEVDPSTYAQNAAPNQAYAIGNNYEPPPPPQASHAGGPVTITVSPLGWKTLPFGGAPALVAVRQVSTPDGELAQGFVVDRATLTQWLASHAGDLVAQLQPGDGPSEVAPGWQLQVTPNPRTAAAASLAAHQIARDFVLRFVAIAAVAAIAAVLVVLLVARAEKLARERSQFAAAAAHELRTPLAGLQLYGDMLADGLGDPSKLTDYARRMSEEAARLGRVVSNVLGFSQLERGNLSVHPELGELGAALHELADRAQPALERAGATLEVDVAPELRARFDRDALARIVGNLLDNAEKYSRSASDRTIQLAARDAGDTIEIAVRDRGPGVADPRALFRPFARGEAADGPAGLGLGLALSRSLARAMGGELSYQPGDAGGAAFALRLQRA